MLFRSYPAETVEAVIQRLTELGLLDDLDYGRRLAADLLNLRGYSLGRVRQELYRRRLDPETIQEVMDGLGDVDQIGPIVALVRKKYLQKLREPQGRGKVAAALQRAGEEARPQAASALFAHLDQACPIAPVAFKNGSVLTQWGRVSGLAPVRGDVFHGLEHWSVS